MFELPDKTVYNLVSRMMMQEELHGSWDQPTRTIVMHNLEASRLQQLAMQFADKAMVMIDLNERALAYRTGGLRDNDEEGGAGSRRRGGGGGQGQWGEEESGGGRSRAGAKLGMVRNMAGAGGRGGGRGDRGGMGGRGDRGDRGDRGERRPGAGGGASYRSGGYGGFRGSSQNMSSLGSYRRE